ncbi:MAG: hypothetical protein WCZ23_04455 [Rhodospirillaceae bacterium]
MTDDLRRQRRFLEEVELAIRAANREIIGGHIPTMTRDAFVRLAVAVGKVRAGYLDGVLAMDWADPSETALQELRHKREMYEEARAGFDALRHCIETGYVDIGDGAAR